MKLQKHWGSLQTLDNTGGGALTNIKGRRKNGIP